MFDTDGESLWVRDNVQKAFVLARGDALCFMDYAIFLPPSQRRYTQTLQNNSYNITYSKQVWLWFVLLLQQSLHIVLHYYTVFLNIMISTDKWDDSSGSDMSRF